MCTAYVLYSVLTAEHTGAISQTALLPDSATPTLSSCSTVSSITWGTRNNDAAADGSDAASASDDASNDVSDDVDGDVASAIAKLNAAVATAGAQDAAPHHSTHQRDHHEHNDSSGAITTVKHKV
jgi:hypothetical protein